MKFLSLLSIAISLSAVSYPQNSVTGTITSHAGQQIKLAGFDGFNIYEIDSMKVSSKGNFTLSFNKNDYGMGYLVTEENKPFIVILAPDENIILEGETLSLPETVVIKSGPQNQLFEQYAREHPRREQALGAWDFLTRIYRFDPVFASHEKPKNDIEAEKQRIREEDRIFLAGLNPDTYVSWYLPLRRLVSSVSTIAQYRTEEIPGAIEFFRGMDYTDPRLYKSGLLSETIEAHFWLIENSGRSLDSVFAEMNISIDLLIGNLVSDGKKFNEIVDYLFKLLEQRSLFSSSEYLALKVLNETCCTIDNDLAAKLESYRVMKPGKTAPDFVFTGDYFTPEYELGKSPKRLSDLNSKYVVVVFGANWCPNCDEVLSAITRLYEKWKKSGVEVVYISLDEDKQAFLSRAEAFPFTSVCDYQKWDSPIVKAYHVFATPTVYVLNDSLEILLRPNSVQHMDSWVEWYLIQDNM